MKRILALCAPAKIYLFLTLFACVMALMNNAPFLAVGVKFAFSLIWTCILSWFCMNGLTTIAWILILMPFIAIFLGMIGMTNMSNMSNK